MNKLDTDLIIIGGGPAGLTAAIYTARASIKTLVIEGNPYGGQLMITSDVENFPGFKDGILGPELIENMRAQAMRFNSEFLQENVVAVSGDFETGFKVETDSGKVVTAKVVLISSGASAKWLGLPNEAKLVGKGVSACATCDGFFFKDKVIAVVGGGDAAMEEASYLTKFASKIFILVRGSKAAMRASKYMIERAQANPKIEFVYNSEIKDVLGETSVEGLKVFNNANNTESTLDVKGLFIAIGHKPNTGFLKDFVELDELGYVKINNGTKTSKKGVFTSGDVADRRYRQAITAAGLGCMAALDIERFLNEE